MPIGVPIIPQDLRTSASPTFAGLTLSGLISGRVVYVTTNGLLIDSPNLTFNTDNELYVSGGIGVGGANESGLLLTLTRNSGSAAMKFQSSTYEAYFLFAVPNTRDSYFSYANYSTPGSPIFQVGCRYSARFSIGDNNFTNEWLTVIAAGRIGIGNVIAPTARLHLGAGTTAVSTAPLKFTSGSLNTTAEAGAVEFLTDKWYATITTGAARKEITLNDAALTSGRVPYSTTNGRLTDSSNFTYVGSSLGINGLTLNGKATTYNSVATEGYGVPAIVDLVNLTNQGADIAQTAFTGADAAGLYRVSYYLRTTTGDVAAGQARLGLAWSDEAGSHPFLTSYIDLTSGTSTEQKGIMFFSLTSATVDYWIEHTGSYGTAKYSLRMICERLN